ncbi:MAG: c-type cytochrome [Nitrospirae bacterium]|nr:c-type cytochrome [Nitrospirota bacterium]
MNKHIFLITILIVCLFISINSYAQSDIPSVDISNYPIEAKEGYKIFSQKCIKCHSAAKPLNAPYSGEAWKTTVYRMMRKEGSFVTQKEADKIYTFLVQYSSSRKPIQAVETKGLPPIDAGKKVYQQRGCAACHIISGTGGKVGPDLTTIGKNRDNEFLYKWLKNPQAVKPATIMPNLNLTDKEIKPLVEYLTSLK